VSSVAFINAQAAATFVASVTSAPASIPASFDFSVSEYCLYVVQSHTLSCVNTTTPVCQFTESTAPQPHQGISTVTLSHTLLAVTPAPVKSTSVTVPDVHSPVHSSWNSMLACQPLQPVTVTTVALLSGSSVTVAPIKFKFPLCAFTTQLSCITCAQPQPPLLCIAMKSSSSLVAYSLCL